MHGKVLLGIPQIIIDIVSVVMCFWARLYTAHTSRQFVCRCCFFHHLYIEHGMFNLSSIDRYNCLPPPTSICVEQEKGLFFWPNHKSAIRRIIIVSISNEYLFSSCKYHRHRALTTFRFDISVFYKFHSILSLVFCCTVLHSST